MNPAARLRYKDSKSATFAIEVFALLGQLAPILSIKSTGRVRFIGPRDIVLIRLRLQKDHKRVNGFMNSFMDFRDSEMLDLP